MRWEIGVVVVLGSDRQAAAPTSAEPPSSAGTATTASTAPTTTAPTTSAVATTPPVPDFVQEVVFGHSVEGRPLRAIERGTPGGTVVLVIGVIHGDEPAGAGVVERLRTAPLPEGIDLWLVDSVNPDGQLAGTRTNALRWTSTATFPTGGRRSGHPVTTSTPERAGQ